MYFQGCSDIRIVIDATKLGNFKLQQYKDYEGADTMCSTALWIKRRTFLPSNLDIPLFQPSTALSVPWSKRCVYLKWILSSLGSMKEFFWNYIINLLKVLFIDLFSPGELALEDKHKQNTLLLMEMNLK